MFYSERLLSGNIANSIVAEYKTYGKYVLPVYTAGVYELTMVGAGGFSQAVYSGDSADGTWTGHQSCTGGAGAYINLLAFLPADRYIITVGALGGGTDVTSTTYRSTKTPTVSQGSTPISTSISNSKNEVLARAGGGGFASYYYTGDQKNDGARYLFNNAPEGGSASTSPSLVIVGTPTLTKGANGDLRSGSGTLNASLNATWNGYGKPNNVSASYQEAYCINYTVSGGTGGYFKLVYKRNAI